jgi:hypothetical protein
MCLTNAGFNGGNRDGDGGAVVCSLYRLRGGFHRSFREPVSKAEEEGGAEVHGAHQQSQKGEHDRHAHHHQHQSIENNIFGHKYSFVFRIKKISLFCTGTARVVRAKTNRKFEYKTA